MEDNVNVLAVAELREEEETDELRRAREARFHEAIARITNALTMGVAFDEADLHVVTEMRERRRVVTAEAIFDPAYDDMLVRYNDNNAQGNFVRAEFYARIEHEQLVFTGFVFRDIVREKRAARWVIRYTRDFSWTYIRFCRRLIQHYESAGKDVRVVRQSLFAISERYCQGKRNHCRNLHANVVLLLLDAQWMAVDESRKVVAAGGIAIVIRSAQMDEIMDTRARYRTGP